jgi:hypothetical protein
MPTGYTAPVEDGTVTDVKDFAAACARAFGAFMHQRDERMDAVLRYPDLDTKFYDEGLVNAKAEISRWQQMSEEDKYKEWSEYAKTQTVQRHKAKATAATKRARYESMLAQVEEVDTPSILENFKNFMVEQLESSIKHDCGNDGFEDRFYGVLSFSEWCDRKAEAVLRDATYYDEQAQKARKRHKESCDFIDTMAATFGFEVEK